MSRPFLAECGTALARGILIGSAVWIPLALLRLWSSGAAQSRERLADLRPDSLMAATKRNAMLIAETRERVQTSQLINRLQDHGFGKIDLVPTQIKAIEILLKKTLPDLQSVTAEVTGADGEPLVPEVDTGKLALMVLSILNAPKEPKG